MENINDALKQLDVLLKKTDLEDVTSESSGFSDLPDGYYLVEVEKAEIKTSKSSGAPMAAFTFKIVDDGISVETDEDDEVSFKKIKHTKNRKIFKYYVFKDETSIKRFAADMLKFEGDVVGESLLPKEAFTNSETVVDALECLIGLRVYSSVSTTENNDGTKSTWTNLISWKRASVLELPQ